VSDDVIEAAKTGRSKCRRCGEIIAKGQLRFGERVENAFGEGLATHWFHIACAAEKRPERLGAAMASCDLELPDRSVLDAIVRSGTENPKLATVKRAERASSGRARCQHCRELIEKGTLRVAVEREEDASVATVSYVHAGCAPEFLGRHGLMDKLRRTSPALEAPDFSELEQLLGQ